MISNPYSADATPERFEVEAKLNLKGTAEFTGVRHHHDKAPTSGMRVCGVDLVFATPAEAEQFASVAMVMANQHHIAWDRNGIGRTRSDVPVQAAPQ